MMGTTGIEGYILAGRGLGGSPPGCWPSQHPAISSRNDQNISFNTLHPIWHWMRMTTRLPFPRTCIRETRNGEDD